MGIPSYFSNLIKQYPHIIKKLIKNDMKVNNFFLDSNSIVYDCVRSINFEENQNETTYQKIIKNVIGKLEAKKNDNGTIVFEVNKGAKDITTLFNNGQILFVGFLDNNIAYLMNKK